MRHGVGAILVRDGLILLGKRSHLARSHHGTWDVFGGHCEPGETDVQTLLRELDEELGVVPTRYRSLGSFVDPPEQPTFRLHLFVVQAWHGTPANRSVEHDAIEWHYPASLSALPLASPALLAILSAVL
jgi:8-oxo-dGTP diphosphatase